ncbi:hypothetical protein JL721_8012 [Aureococcus anophagefferens]|nr:hypothetical protein JL721_8012 [Aureococcus anophagefferens]
MDATDVDLEYGAAATPVDAAKPEHDYAQHFDADVVIPDRIARPAVASAHCFLALAVVSFLRGYDVLAAVALGLYGTSVNHWRRPRVTSWRHAADLLAVAATAAYGSYLATARARSPVWTAACGASAFGRFAAADESSLPMPDVAQPWTAQNGRSGPFIALACLLFAQRLAPEAPRGRGAP